MKSIWLFLTIIILAACKDDKEIEQIDVFQIKNIGILSTSEYTIGKIIRMKDDKEWYKLGDRNILISCKAKVKAGVNLMDLNEDDISVDGDKLIITLPPVEITSFEMDPSLVNTEMVDINGFRGNFTQEEKNKLLRLGEKSIRDHLGETNILKDAERNAAAFVKDFYKELGFKEVIVESGKMNQDEK